VTEERRLQGIGAADGIVVGPVYRVVDVDVPSGGAGGPAEQASATRALRAVAERLGAAASRLREAGRTDEAEIVEASQLMADDPTLLADVDALAASRPAIAALIEATERHAAVLASIPDPYLAARAADVRRLGRQAARLAEEAPPPARLPPSPPQWGGCRRSRYLRRAAAGGGASPVVLVARDLGPADLAEIELAGVEIGGIALADGSATSHAAIVARSWGVPLVIGLGETALAVPEHETVVLDGLTGALVVTPDVETVRQARAEIARRERRQADLARGRAAGAVTTDGQPIRLLVNAGTERDVVAGLTAGAEGVGLVRTELAFLDAINWPTEAEHLAALEPLLRHLDGKLVTARTLDFGADKLPPFLLDRTERGVSLQLAAPEALLAQLRAFVRAASRAGLRIMLPLVEHSTQLAAARDLLVAARHVVAPDAPLPPLGAMIESRRAVESADAIAAEADFLSIGTNDLVQDLLGLDRLTPAGTITSAADPRVLRAIHVVAQAAVRHGRTVEVCGESAGDRRLAVLLIGLGVSELSVAPSRIDEVRGAVRSVSRTRAAELAEAALVLDSAAAVLTMLEGALTAT
jgi:phosphoenolpyruvate-protein kinase (PTS system EI component)